MTSAVILGMIVTMFPEPREQARAIGAFAFVASAGGAVGLLVGGALTQSINWHWIFFVNIPIGVGHGGARAASGRRRAGHRAGRAAPTSSGAVHGHRRADARRVHDRRAGRRPTAGRAPVTLCCGPASLALLAAVRAARAHGRSTRSSRSGIFRSRNVTGANVIQMLGVAGMFGIFFLGSLYLKKVLGYDAMEIGFAFLPTTVLMGGAVGALHRTAGDAVRRPPGDDRRSGAHRRAGSWCSPGRRSTRATACTCCR